MRLKKILSVLVVLAVIAIPVISLAATAPITNPAPQFFVNVPGDGSFKSIFEFIIESILLPLVGTICLLFIILGGYRYVTSGGDQEAAESGKKMISNAVIGLVIIIFSYIIVNLVVNVLKGTT